MTEKVLVTGGGGFLGSAVTRMLLERGDKVHVLGRNNYPELEKLGAICFKGDIRNPEDVEKAAVGVDVIHHVAALPGVWGKKSDFFSINFDGTLNVLVACEKLNIPRLVHTSSPSVVHDGSAISGASELQCPISKNPQCHYAASKAMAEVIALKMDNKTILPDGSKLRVTALRPHLIWGPRDKNMIPRIITRARAGKLRIVGKGLNKVDTVYIDNAAYAQLLAADQLRDNPDQCGGKAYFITQGEPVLLWDFINEILANAGAPIVAKRIPYPMAWLAGLLMESFHHLFRPSVEPLMTRFLAQELSHDHWFDISAARQDLNYSPLVSTKDGLEILQNWILDNPQLFK